MSLKKFDLKRDFTAGVHLFKAPSPPRVLFGVVKQFCKFYETGQKQSVKLLQNMDSNTTQYPPPPMPPPSHTLSVYIYEGGKGVGEVNQRGAIVHKAGSKYHND
jgi:hypothetical protein